MEIIDKNRYEHFKINFKGLSFEVKLIDNNAYFPNTDEKDKSKHEQFKIILRNEKENKEIEFYFYNSTMEKGISEILNNKEYPIYSNVGLLNIGQLKQLISKKFMWGGYDKIKNTHELTQERIYYLIYGIITSIAYDIEADLSSFSEFCSSFGYDNDSKRAEAIYREMQKQQDKIRSLKLSEELQDYLINEAGQENDKFQIDLRGEIK